MGRHSIRVKITLLLTIIIAFLLILLMVVNSTMAESFYLKDKKEQMIKVYDNINEILTKQSDGTITSEQMSDEIDLNVSDKNLSIIVVNSDWTTLYTNRSGEAELLNRLRMSMFNRDIFDMFKEDGEKTPGDNKPQDGKIPGVDKIFDDRGASINMSGSGYMDGREIVVETDMYTMQKVYDERLVGEYYELWGTFDNGSSVMMRMAVQSVKDNVSISNTFIAYIGSGVLIVGVIVAFFFSQYFTKPIMELSSLAVRMANMDFDAKYEGKDKGEIGVLGSNMNNMSSQLEENIRQLKVANIELQKDIDKKNEMEQMRSDFISNVSHELKTPIALIQGYAEGLKEGVNDDPESMEFYCDVIIDEAVKMNTMVKKLLTLNQIEFGNEELVMERFDVIELINSVVAANELRASQNGIIMEVQSEYSSIEVWSDEYKVEEIITNYVTNAINHCKYDNKIIVRAVRLEDVVRVFVYNTGDHIPQEDIENIWLKFYKVDKARTREYGGNGIGLSIVKAIADSYGKECGVNNVDGGVEFWFDLDAKV